MPVDTSYDALVVGARCAGAATAMLMARKGMRVLLIDRGDYGTDTVSTHALMRGGVLQLHRWGIAAAGARPRGYHRRHCPPRLRLRHAYSMIVRLR